MSLTITTAFMKKYERKFRKEFQAGMQDDKDLINYVNVARQIKNELILNVYGELTARKMTDPFGPAISSDPDKRTVTIKSDIYTEGVLMHWYDDAQAIAEESSVAVQTLAACFKRARNQIIIDTMNSATFDTTNTVAVDYGGSDANLTYDKINKAAELLLTKNVPLEDVTLVIHASQKRSLLDDEKLTSGDYRSLRPVESGNVGTILGMKVIAFGDFNRSATADPTGSGNNGLPKTGDDRTCFAFHKAAVGYGQHRDIKMVMRNRNGLDGDVKEAKGYMDLGGAVVHDEGIIKILCDETK